MTKPTDGTDQKRYSGKKIVPLVYGLAVLMCVGLLWYGLSIRGLRDNAPLGADEQAILAGMPREWTRITDLKERVEGQGWSIYVPCNAEAGTLVIQGEAENPRVLCSFCDSVQEGKIRRVEFAGEVPHPVRLQLDGGGEVFIEPVDAMVASRFAGARLEDYVLTWTLADATKMFFVPSLAARNFKVLKAEDKNPEGCGSSK